jgi:hypothetical protein
LQWIIPCFDALFDQCKDGIFFYIIAGNVPASLMAASTTDEVRAYCDDLVELFEGDAYIMAHGCYFENSTDEKLRAFLDSVKQ